MLIPLVFELLLRVQLNSAEVILSWHSYLHKRKDRGAAFPNFTAPGLSLAVILLGVSCQVPASVVGQELGQELGQVAGQPNHMVNGNGELKPDSRWTGLGRTTLSHVT